jgi:uncharacterized Rossmann fold enzyme
MLLEDKTLYTVREQLDGPVNHPHKEIYRQIRQNIRRQLPQAQPFPPNEFKAFLLCGGPSLSEHIPAIRRKRKQGYKALTVNGTHDWALDHGITPSLYVSMDARPLNAEFVRRPQLTCRYFIASQSHPDVFDALEEQDVHIWHGGAPSKTEKRILNAYYQKRWLSIFGGSSVGPRAIFIAYLLGIRHLDVYGLDGCLIGRRHHPYAQSQNDFETQYVVQVSRRRFRMHGWMLKQLDEWLQLGSLIPNDLKLTLHGNGVIAYVTQMFSERKSPPKLEVLDIEQEESYGSR